MVNADVLDGLLRSDQLMGWILALAHPPVLRMFWARGAVWTYEVPTEQMEMVVGLLMAEMGGRQSADDADNDREKE